LIVILNSVAKALGIMAYHIHSCPESWWKATTLYGWSIFQNCITTNQT